MSPGERMERGPLAAFFLGVVGFSDIVGVELSCGSVLLWG